MPGLIKPETTALGVLGDRLYTRQQAQAFVGSVVLPAINYLHREAGYGDFFVSDNIGEKFEPPIFDGTCLEVELNATVRPPSLHREEIECYSLAQLDVSQRLYDDEEMMGLTPDADTQLWRDTSYRFVRPNSYRPVSVIDQFVIRDNESQLVHGLSRQQKAIIRSSSVEHFAKDPKVRSELTRTRVVEIFGLLELAAVPKDILGEMEATFDNRLVALRRKA